MPPEELELLKRSVEIAEENNKMLKSLHRSMRWRRIMSIVYWVLIIGSTIGAWYFIQPFIDQVVGAYGGAKANFSNFSEVLQNFKKQ